MKKYPCARDEVIDATYGTAVKMTPPMDTWKRLTKSRMQKGSMKRAEKRNCPLAMINGLTLIRRGKSSIANPKESSRFRIVMMKRSEK